MGEAKRRQQELALWRNSLSQDERTVADVSISLFKNFIAPFGFTGGCYHMAFLLTEYLRTKRNVLVAPVVGFINDGTDEIMISHAWVELNSKKIDISLAITENQLSGSLLILDRPMTRGDCTYSYHLTEPPASRQASEIQGAQNPRWKEVMIEKDAEHRRMTEIATDQALIREYLDSAPEELSFEAITSFIDE